MQARLRVTLAALLLMVVALVAHTASQDSVAGGAVAIAGHAPDSEVAHTHNSVFADPDHVAGDQEPATPSCPSDRRSAHDDTGTPVSRLTASGFALSVPAQFSEPAPCAASTAVVAPGRSVLVVQASGVDLCTELCVSRR